MLKKSFRLREKEDFERVFRRGNPLFFGAIGCKIAKNNEGHIRVGFSLSKKHLGAAVWRNKLRRTIIAAFWVAGKEKILTVPADIVFFTAKKLKKEDIKPFASQVQSIVEYIKNI